LHPELRRAQSNASKARVLDHRKRPWFYFAATVFTGSDCGIALMLKPAGGSANNASGL
jgi:hypothetical protein